MKETTRELKARWENLTFEEKKNELKQRREKALPKLKRLLRPGIKFRATKAECCAREATFEFLSWEGSCIISKSGCEISPSQVFSIEGKVLFV